MKSIKDGLPYGMRIQSRSQVALKSVGLFQYFKFIFHISYKITIVGVWPWTSPKFWLVVCKRNLHTGITLLFYVPLPWALISECQPHDRAIEASLSLRRFPFSLPLYPPSPCRWRSSGQLQPQCLLLNLCFPLQVPCGISKTEQLWPEEDS